MSPDSTHSFFVEGSEIRGNLAAFVFIGLRLSSLQAFLIASNFGI
jgi:hypothetical protein